MRYKVPVVSRYAGDCPWAFTEAHMPCGNWTIVLWLHRKFGRSACQPGFLDAMDRTPRIR